MTKGLDDLLRYLVKEIALQGETGAGPAEIENYARAFYGHSNGESGKLDRAFLEQLWHWLLQHPDIRLATSGGAEELSQLSLSEVEAHNDRAQQALAPGSSTQDGTKASQIRLYASEEQMWQALTGHSPDKKRIADLEFSCLSSIGSYREKGIAQPLLVRLTGQDKRSLPERTSKLARNGYIVKKSVVWQGCATSLLILSQFAASGISKLDSSEIEGTWSERRFSKYEPLIREALEVLEKRNLIPWVNLRALLDIPLRDIAGKRVLEAFRRLAHLGCLEQILSVTALVTNDSSRGGRRSIRLIRSVTEDDWDKFWGFGREYPQWGPGSHGATKDTIGDEDINSNEEEDDDEDDEEEEEEEHRLGGSAVPDLYEDTPIWNPDRHIVNTCFKAIEMAGENGAITPDACNLATGVFYRRPTASLLYAMSETWHVHRPIHLTVLRDAAQVGRKTLYRYYTFENFRSGVEAGKLTWEAVSRPCPSDSDIMRSKAFMTFTDSQFANGSSTLMECLKSALAAMPAQTTYRRNTTGQGRGSGPAKVRQPRLPRGVAQRKYAPDYSQEELDAMPAEKRKRIVNSIETGRRYHRNKLQARIDEQIESGESFENIATEIEHELSHELQQNPGNHSVNVRLDALRRMVVDFRNALYLPSKAAHSRPYLEQPHSVVDGKIPNPKPGRGRGRARGRARGRPRKQVAESPKPESSPQPIVSDDVAASRDTDNIETQPSRKRKRRSSVAIAKPAHPITPTRPHPRGKRRSVVADAEQGSSEQSVSTRMSPSPIGAGQPASRHVALDPSLPSREKPQEGTLGPKDDCDLAEPEAEVASTKDVQMTYAQQYLALPPRENGLTFGKTVRLKTNKRGRGPKSLLVVIRKPSTMAAHTSSNDLSASPEIEPGESVPRLAARRRSSRLILGETVPKSVSDPNANSGPGFVAIGDAIIATEDRVVRPETDDLLRVPLENGAFAKDNGTSRPVGISVSVVIPPRHKDSDQASSEPPSIRNGVSAVDQQTNMSLQKHHRDISTKTTLTDQAPSKPPVPIPEVFVEAAAQTMKGVGRHGGSQVVVKKQIILDIIKKCGGIFPGDREIWYPFTSDWISRGHAKPDTRTVMSLVKQLVDSGKLQRLGFGFQTAREGSKIKHILLLPEVPRDDERIAELREEMIARFPKLYIPESAGVSEAFRRHPETWLAPGQSDTGWDRKVIDMSTPMASISKKSLASMRERGAKTAIERLRAWQEDLVLKQRQVQAAQVSNDSNGEDDDDDNDDDDEDDEEDAPVEEITASHPQRRRIAVTEEAKGGLLRRQLRQADEMLGEPDFVLSNYDPDLEALERTSGLISQQELESSFNPNQVAEPVKKRRARWIVKAPKALVSRTIEGKALEKDYRIGRVAALRMIESGAVPYIPATTQNSGDFCRRILPKSGTRLPSLPQGPLDVRALRNTPRTQNHGLAFVEFKIPSDFQESRETVDKTETQQVFFASTGTFGTFLQQPTWFVPTSLGDILSRTFPGKPVARQLSYNATTESRLHRYLHMVAEWEKYDPSALTGSRDGYHFINVNPYERHPSKRALEPVRRPILPQPRAIERQVDKIERVGKRGSARLDRQEDTRKKQRRSTRMDADETMSDMDVMFAVLISITLFQAGDTRYINWEVTGLLLENKYEISSLKRRWHSMRKPGRAWIEKVRPHFESAFLQAYEKGLLPDVDYQDVDKTDWPLITKWVKEAFGHKVPSIRSRYGEMADTSERLTPSSRVLRRYEAVPSRSETYGDVYEIKQKTSHAKRREWAHFKSLVMGERSVSTSRRQAVDHAAIARSWVRANILAPASCYRASEAAKKLSSVPELNIEDALQHYVDSKTFVTRNKGRDAPERGYDISEKFILNFKTGMDIKMFDQAAAFKRDLDTLFEGSGSAPVSFHADEGSAVACINMLAAGLIEIVPSNIRSDPMGLLEGSYRTRTIDKDLLRFDMELRPTSKYVKGNPLQPLPPLPRAQSMQSRTGIDMTPLPVWIDIHGKEIKLMWQFALCLLLSVIVVRPYLVASEVLPYADKSLELWEIELLMEWAVKSGAAEWADSAHDAICLKEWWWLAMDG